MSYDIYIGNAEFEIIDDYSNDKPFYYDIHVPAMKHPDAPSFVGDDLTGNGNSRHPGYTQWGEFCRTAGLYELFFDDESGLMHRHPGNAVLRQDHAEKIEQALKRWQKKHPDVTPGWDEGQDGILARLIWLDWWVKYAIQNCERPCIENH